ncbi:MAG: hypothetical protein QFC55_01040 [Chloroflexota bacterium]|nr:hypothetical protein [Chloroflexota bacterium]
MNRVCVVFAAVALVLGCTSATPTPTPTVPAPPRPTADLTAQIGAVTGSVPAVRELQPTRDVPFEFITRDQFQANLANLFNSDVPESVRATEARLFKRLGLLPADADMNALVNELYGAQVLAYYNPDDGKFYVIQRDQPFNATDKLVVAHEYTHALQDQHFNLKDNTITDNSRGDAQLAQLAVIEGDATLTSQLWANDHLGLGDLLQLLVDGFSALDTASLDGVPLILRRQLEFPYTEGFTFATALHDQGGYDAVNDALITPPASTEQILHPDKYFAHEGPVEVSMPDISSSLGTGWSLAYQQTIGELLIQILAAGGETPQVAIPGIPAEWAHADVAAGWNGDRLNMYENTDGSWLIGWQTDWDTQADAVAFRARIDELAGTFGGQVDLHINGATVDVAIRNQ